MRILMIDACPRGADSRTLRMAEAFRERCLERRPEVSWEILRLDEMGLMPLTGETLAAREALIAGGETGHPLFAPARAFREADMIVIAAPYWDFMFPASLKTFIEHICVRTLTFDYADDAPVGLCRAETLVYLTSAGGVMEGHDHGFSYLRGVTGGLLGVRRFEEVRCEGLDMAGNDPQALLADACRRARLLADALF
ncbi:MAG: NAD(P)H-dependent oxidoreductase [Clostridia bacterium]|nr:NAD(P)H-dependent oxidoreductase [Clostridia bacterium]